MALCLITSGVTLSCGEYNTAGLSNIYIANQSEISAITYDVNGQVTGITMDPGKVFFEYEFGEDTAFFTQPFTNTNGNIAYTQSLEFRIPNEDQEIINTLSQLDFAKMTIIVKKRNGKFFILGETNPLKRTGGENSSGTAATDASGVQIILTGGGPGPARQVASTVVTTVI